MFLVWSNYLEYLSWLSGMAALQNSDTLANRKELLQLLCMDFDLNRHLVKSQNRGYLLLID